MKTNLRICLPEKCNVSLIIGREKKSKKTAKGDGKEDKEEGGGGRSPSSSPGRSTQNPSCPLFVGLENEPLLEEEHVQVTKRRLGGGENENVAVEVKAIGKSAVYIQSDSKNLSELKRNLPAFLQKGQTMFLRYVNNTKEFAVAFVVEEEEDNEEPIEVLEIEDSDSGGSQKNAEGIKGEEEEEVEIIEKKEEEANGFGASAAGAKKRVLRRRKFLVKNHTCRHLQTTSS